MNSEWSGCDCLYSRHFRQWPKALNTLFVLSVVDFCDHLSWITHCSCRCSRAALSKGTATQWRWDCHASHASFGESLIRQMYKESQNFKSSPHYILRRRGKCVSVCYSPGPFWLTRESPTEPFWHPNAVSRRFCSMLKTFNHNTLQWNKIHAYYHHHQNLNCRKINTHLLGSSCSSGKSLSTGCSSNWCRDAFYYQTLRRKFKSMREAQENP